MDKLKKIWQPFCDLIESFIDKYQGWLTIIPTTFIAVLGPAGDFLPLTDEQKFYSYITLFILFVFVAFISYKDQANLPKIRELKNELQQQRNQLQQQQNQIHEIEKNIFILFDGLLLNLAKKLEITGDSESRVSIYVHHEDNGHFIPYGRYSSNPKFKKKGREVYPENQGCIGKAWEHGWDFDTFPKKRDAHFKKCSSGEYYNMSKETHDKLTMVSCLYAVKRLDKESNKPVAIIVFESMKKDRFSKEKIKIILDDAAKDYADIVSVFLKQILATSSDIKVKEVAL